MLQGPQFPALLAAADDIGDDTRARLATAFHGLMHALFREKGAALSIDMLQSRDVQRFIDTHTDALSEAMQQAPLSDIMRQRLTQSNYVFSGMKTFHELSEAFPSLLDENGKRKPFEQFFADVRSIDETYNRRYLRAEYGFVQASASMASKWEQFSQDGDQYYLQYRTAGDDQVRPEHAALDGITLPQSDPFWNLYYPPNGWNCRCTVVQVRRTKYHATPQAGAMERGAKATAKDAKGMFRFNPGKEQKAFPDYNPYTISRCRDCDVAKGKNLGLAKPLNCDTCNACQLIREMAMKEQGKKLQDKERKDIRDAASKWVENHLQIVTLPRGEKAKRMYVTNSKTKDNIAISKQFFNETFAKNKKSPRLAETMRLATKVPYWLENAAYIRTEDGRHHNLKFKVFMAQVGDVSIECKAKVFAKELLLYTMRIT